MASVKARSASLLFVTIDDPHLPNSRLSGHYLWSALSRRYGVQVLGPLRVAGLRRGYFGARSLLLRALTGKLHPSHCEPALLKMYSKLIGEVAEESGARLVVTNLSHLMSPTYVQTPYVVVSDATVWNLEALGGYFDGWAKSSLAKLRDWDKAAIEGASTVFYTSSWAAASARLHTDVKSERVRVIPPGANLESVGTPECDPRRRNRNQCRLLFYGRDWYRKGGPIAVRVAQILTASGLDSTLVVCGPTTLPVECKHFRCVEYVPPVLKNSQESMQAFHELCNDIDYHILPSASDCTPLAVAELASFGIPSIAADVGGMSSMIDHGKSGFLMPADANADAYASLLMQNFLDDHAWLAIRRGARHKYEEELNWDSSVARMAPIIDQLLESSN